MTYDPPHKTDYVTEAQARLLTQYQNKADLSAIQDSHSRRLQEIENALWEIILYREFGTAEGAQLDALGRIVGAFRGSLTEAQFARAISVAILLLRSQGDPDKIEKIATLVLPDDVHFTYADEDTATIRIEVIDTLSDADARLLFRTLQRARLGGVRLMVSVPVALVPSQTFYLADYYSGIAPLETNGLADFYSSWPTGLGGGGGDPGSLNNLFASG